VTAASAAPARAAEIASDRAAWDAALLAAGGHMLQSWRWGAFKARFGWAVERLAVPAAGGAALAQILFRSRAGVSIGYLPRGPALPPDETASETLWDAIDRVARRRRTLAVIVEPDRPLAGFPALRRRFVVGPPHIQPVRTVKVDLLDDEALLAQMHPKTRYNVRLALRRGVVARRAAAGPDTVEAFYALLADTAQRNDFGIHDASYYRAFLDEFGDDAVVIFAETDGKTVAGLIAAAFGDEAIYMYGASSTKERAHGAGFYIQYEAMRWARERGCRRYDLWGIPAHDPPSTEAEAGDRLAGTTGQDWRGLYEFKTRFGGQIVTYPPTLERQYWPGLATLARRFYSAGSGP
jgi:lipid II:glycine glycyltransferase (peptidoglycan interpeptide bridge formation enzyme)